MLKAITFDLDDTLWDPRPAFVRAEQAQQAWLQLHAPAVAEHYPPEVLREHRRALAERRPDIAHDFTRMRIAQLSELLDAAGYPPRLAVEGVAVFVHERSRVDLFDDALPVLAELSRNLVLVALTNGNADLRVAGVDAYFAACISPAEAGVRKPDPAMFHAALARVGLDRSAAVHVGDQPLYDIEGARRAAMPAIWLNRDRVAWPAEYPPPAREIHSLSELPAALGDLGQRAQ